VTFMASNVDQGEKRCQERRRRGDYGSVTLFHHPRTSTTPPLHGGRAGARWVGRLGRGRVGGGEFKKWDFFAGVGGGWATANRGHIARFFDPRCPPSTGPLLSLFRPQNRRCWQANPGGGRAEIFTGTAEGYGGLGVIRRGKWIRGKRPPAPSSPPPPGSSFYGECDEDCDGGSVDGAPPMRPRSATETTGTATGTGQDRGSVPEVPPPVKSWGRLR